MSSYHALVHKLIEFSFFQIQMRRKQNEIENIFLILWWLSFGYFLFIDEPISALK